MGRQRPGGGLSTAQQAAKFLGVSVLSGAVLAGLALPAVGALGLAAKGTIQGFDEIPTQLTRPPLSQKTTILDAEGGKIADVYSRNRTVVGFDEIAPHMRQAIIAIEDARFYEHGAIDLRGVLRALNRNIEEGTTSEGASTLTQQYVKNVFVEEAGNDADAVAEATRQTVGRKIRELKYAIQLEEELTKDQILENYLNITFFGQQAYGVEAASQRYFSKSAADLELHEAALLAGLVQSPSRYDPVNDEQEAKKRRNVVLQRMEEVGDITPEESAEARERDLGLEVSRPQNGCITAVHDAGFFCDYVRQEFLSNKIFGDDEAERRARWDLGGMTIRTTLSPKAQAASASAAVSRVNPDDSVAATVVQVEPGTGHILSMAQSRPYGNDPNEHQTTINLNVSHAMGGSTYGFQPGSTFKPITAAAALEKGINPDQTYSSGNELELPMRDFQNCEGQPLGNSEDHTWELQNESEDMEGTWDMTEALGRSVNTYFAMLQQDAGMCETALLAAEMGVERGDNDPLGVNPSMTLGGETIAPLQMANAYATFANRGVYCSPVAITGVTDAEGDELPIAEADCSRVMSELNADYINMMLLGVVQDGTGQAAGLTGRDNAGKTGTTDGRHDAWFVGYTPDVSTAVRVGSDGDLLRMYDITIGGQYYDKVTGGGLPGPIWKEAMNGALDGVPASSFNHEEVPRGNMDDDEEEDQDDNRPGGGRPGGQANGGGDWDWEDPDTWPDFLSGGANGGPNGNRGRGD
ncbi:transglycosylase domain-containing protein [Streptomyces sp. ACA25]|uniref:transglycosylase domain-containing protein n=1 Tax=Streptomyces sp. ACA25 TaxID=3022596 RepID=UPI0023080E9F|nr:transglycosylase domain-containing protein [Streptomyces sp. ACA25]MDB1086484.1 transglycosylase domain-containing protein [Streptomyces sp. ACA25]